MCSNKDSLGIVGRCGRVEFTCTGTPENQRGFCHHFEAGRCAVGGSTMRSGDTAGVLEVRDLHTENRLTFRVEFRS